MLPPFFSSGHRAQRGGLNRSLQQLLNTNVPGFPAFLGSAVFRNCGLPQSNVMLKVTNSSLRDGAAVSQSALVNTKQEVWDEALMKVAPTSD